MDFAVINVPAAPVRRRAGHSREMVNQLLFGETVKILKSKKEMWVRVRSLHDGYEGWMTNTLLEGVAETTAKTKNAFVTTDVLSTIRVGEMNLHIPVGSSLPFFEEGNGKLGTIPYNYSGHYFNREEQQPGAALIHQLTSAWLNAPYLWGGRTPLGVDCSGFVQVVYKLLGIDLPRDAWQQAQVGRSVKKFGHIQPGDLAFFDNKEDIVHVGILLGDEKIIHASGKVKVDEISKKGIYNTSTGKLTNKLRALKRLW